MPALTEVMPMDTQVPKGLNRIEVARAEALMREALLLLDHAGAGLVRVQLQHAIDTLDLMAAVATRE